MSKAKRTKSSRARVSVVKRVLDHYERQSDEEAAAEIASAPLAEDATWMRIPVRLVPQVKRLIARRKATA